MLEYGGGYLGETGVSAVDVERATGGEAGFEDGGQDGRDLQFS